MVAEELCVKEVKIRRVRYRVMQLGWFLNRMG